MTATYKILILGASYGSLLGAKMALAGHSVTLVCLPEEVQLINAEGARVRMAARGVDGLVELNTQNMPGKLSAAGPGDVNPADYDLVGLAMQEPQYGVPVLHDLLDRVAAANVPCISIMNMPPLTYLRRIPGLDIEAIKSSYTDASVWDNLDPALMTLCSPDPQAFRPPTEKINVLQTRTWISSVTSRRISRPYGSTSATARSNCRSSSGCTIQSSFRSRSGAC
jgi:hypothetical protein